MTWAELKAWADNPDVLIANHSKDHGHLIQKPHESDAHWEERINTSLDAAQQTLTEKLGPRPPLFAYPYGEFDDKLEAAIAEREWLGYGQQSGAIGEPSVPTRLPRFPMATAYGQLDPLKNKLLSRAMPISPDQLPGGILQSNPPELELSLPETMDPARLTCFATGQGRIDIQQKGNQKVVIQATSPFNSRRLRYNCTYPIDKGRFYWLSHQWVDLDQPED